MNVVKNKHEIVVAYETSWHHRNVTARNGRPYAECSCRAWKYHMTAYEYRHARVPLDILKFHHWLHQVEMLVREQTPEGGVRREQRK